MKQLASLNNLELWLTRDPRHVRAAQALRYEVFCREMGASYEALPVSEGATGLDRDSFDAIADHLVVIDAKRSSLGAPEAVGCYRLLRRRVAEAEGGFYTAREFDLSGLSCGDGEAMELGRSCVADGYRNGTVMQLLWRGIAEYVDAHRVGVMLGCASLPGTDVAAVAPALAYLRQHFLAPEGLRVRARPGLFVPLNPGTLTPRQVRDGKRMLPPLLKAYLRMGGVIGEGAVIDERFNTIDVCVVLPVARVRERYQRHYRQRRDETVEAT